MDRNLEDVLARYDENTRIWVFDEHNYSYYEGELKEIYLWGNYDYIWDSLVLDWYTTSTGEVWITIDRNAKCR